MNSGLAWTNTQKNIVSLKCNSLLLFISWQFYTFILIIIILFGIRLAKFLTNFLFYLNFDVVHLFKRKMKINWHSIVVDTFSIFFISFLDWIEQFSSSWFSFRFSAKKQNKTITKLFEIIDCCKFDKSYNFRGITWIDQCLPIFDWINNEQ